MEAHIMQALELVCEFGSQCYDIDPSLFSTIAHAFAEAVFYALTLVSVIGTIWGASRKIWRTVSGKNLALKSSV